MTNLKYFHSKWWFKFFLAPVLVTILGGAILYWILPQNRGEKVVQTTEGDQSPAVVSEGNVSIKYETDLPKEAKALMEQLYIKLKGKDEELDRIYEKYKKIEVEKTIEKLSNLYKNQKTDISKQAQQEAVDFFSSLPDRKQKILDSIERKKREAEEAYFKIPILVNYIISEFDTKIAAYQTIDNEIKIEKYPIQSLIVDMEEKRSVYHLRKVDFPNGCSLSVTIKTTHVDNSQVYGGPEIRIIEKSNISQNRSLQNCAISTNIDAGRNGVFYELTNKFLWMKTLKKVFLIYLKTLSKRHIREV